MFGPTVEVPAKAPLDIVESRVAFIQLTEQDRLLSEGAVIGVIGAKDLVHIVEESASLVGEGVHFGVLPGPTEVVNKDVDIGCGSTSDATVV